RSFAAVPAFRRRGGVGAVRVQDSRVLTAAPGDAAWRQRSGLIAARRGNHPRQAGDTGGLHLVDQDRGLLFELARAASVVQWHLHERPFGRQEPPARIPREADLLEELLRASRVVRILHDLPVYLRLVGLIRAREGVTEEPVAGGHGVEQCRL